MLLILVVKFDCLLIIFGCFFCRGIGVYVWVMFLVDGWVLGMLVVMYKDIILIDG